MIDIFPFCSFAFPLETVTAYMSVLRELLQSVPHIAFGDTNIEITYIATDSRTARAGSIFVAIPGVNLDGHQFIPDAIGQGAGAIMGERTPETLDLPEGIPYIQVADARLALAWLAAGFYDHPARQIRMIGVTGTDGKTDHDESNLSHTADRRHPDGYDQYGERTDRAENV